MSGGASEELRVRDITQAGNGHDQLLNHCHHCTRIIISVNVIITNITKPLELLKMSQSIVGKRHELFLLQLWQDILTFMICQYRSREKILVKARPTSKV